MDNIVSGYVIDKSGVENIPTTIWFWVVLEDKEVPYFRIWIGSRKRYVGLR